MRTVAVRHIVAGAASGAWYQGDVGINGTPFALQRQGAPKGFLVLDLDGTSYRETYYGANLVATGRCGSRCRPRIPAVVRDAGRVEKQRA